MIDSVANRLIDTLPRDLLIDLADMGITRARQAHDIIKNQTDLTGKRARGAEGQIRFRIMEQGFEQICESHGGTLLEGGIIEGSDTRIFQPFMRFSKNSEPGIILGLASMPSKGEIPVKNMSRSAGVILNYNLVPRLALDEKDPKPGDIFVLFLAARDPAKSGLIEEIAVGIIDAGYQDFLFYETMETFIARYAKPETTSLQHTEKAIQKPLVKLKRQAFSYIPPEADGSSEHNETTLTE